MAELSRYNIPAARHSFYVDVKQRKYTATGTLDLGSWSDGLDLMTRDVAPGTQLAVSRTVYKNRFQIRLFYQLTDDILSQTVYQSDKGQWAVSPIESEDGVEFKACPNSSLAAASSGGTRLYYQNTSKEIVEIKESDGLWTDRKLALFAEKMLHLANIWV